jgi:penicillin-binding protein 1C
VALFLGSTALLGLMFLWYSRDLPNPDSLVTRNIPQSTKIFDKTGTHLLYEIAPEEKRTLVKIEDIPTHLQKAVITAEDRGFYDHHGISLKGLARAVIFGGSRGGGSTITQQFVKNAILTNERHLSRKIKEIILSFALEQRFTKDQILQLYLNEIPYGGVLYGVESASQAYFEKSISEVTLAEAATLAALPQRPSTFLARPDLLDARRDWILEGMVEEGYISPEEATLAQAEEVVVHPSVGKIEAPHFVLWVKAQLEEEYGVSEVETGGLQVITTLDFDLQQAAEEAVEAGVAERGPRFGFTGAGLLAIEPSTGEIQAMVGSPDFYDTDHSGQVNVTLQPLQPGSSIKPIIYARAFERGYTPDTILWDVKTDFGGYSPNNYDGAEHGPVTIREALQRSLNIPAVQALYLIGVNDAISYMQKLGYSTNLDADRVGLSMVLGGAEVTMLDHVGAYATFAADGVRRAPTSLKKVTNSEGVVLFEALVNPGEKIVASDIAATLSNVLSDNAARAATFGGSNYLTLPDRPAATKTGTTNNYKDAWSVGYTPQLATGVWVGNSDGSLMSRGADGSQVAAPIWQNFMKAAHLNRPVVNFGPYQKVTTGKAVLDGQLAATTVILDRATGKLATDRTPLTFQEVKVCGEYHSTLHYVDKGDVRGPAPSNPERDPFYLTWEKALSDYLIRRNSSLKEGEKPYENCQIPTEFDDIHTQANEPSIRLISPQKNEVIEGQLTLAYESSTVLPFNRIEITLDGQYVGRLQDGSGGQIALPPWIKTGDQTLQVTVFDEVDNEAHDSVRIRVNGSGQALVNFVTPTDGEVITRPSTPFIVGLEILEDNINSLILLATHLNSGTVFVLGELQNPGSAVAIPWNNMTDGSYRLEAVLSLEGGGLATSAPIEVTVRPPPNPSLTL